MASKIILVITVCVSIFFSSSYVKINWQRIDDGLASLPLVLKNIISLGKKQQEKVCYSDIKKIEDHYFAFLTSSSIPVQDSEPRSSISVNLSGTIDSKNISYGIIPSEIVGKFLGSFVQISLRVPSNKSLSELDVYQTRELTATRGDANGFVYYDHTFNRNGKDGDFIFVDGRYSFEVNNSKKQPRIVTVRSIFPSRGQWPSIGSKVRMVYSGEGREPWHSPFVSLQTEKTEDKDELLLTKHIYVKCQEKLNPYLEIFVGMEGLNSYNYNLEIDSSTHNHVKILSQLEYDYIIAKKVETVAEVKSQLEKLNAYF